MNQKRIALFLIGFLLAGKLEAQVIPEKELVITNLSVVNSDHARFGGFSFRQLTQQLKGEATDTTRFIEDWIYGWSMNRFVDGLVVPGRQKALSVLKNWPRLSTGELDINKPPFILNAIVVRLDQSAVKKVGGSGQLRFIFQALTGDLKTRRVMINFEFNLPTDYVRGIDVKYWAKRFHELSALPFGSEYNEKLASIVQEVLTLTNQNDLQKFRLQTGDGEFSSDPEMRSFCLDKERQTLTSCLDRLTPDLALNTPNKYGGKLDELLAWIKVNAKEILSDDYKIPKRFQSGYYPVGNFIWAEQLNTADDPNLAEVRHHFAMNTCNGCHSPRETSSVVMIGDRVDTSKESEWSPFLKKDVIRRKQFVESLLFKK